MVDYFKEALRGEGLVFVANSVMSPAMTKGDGHFLTPLIYSRDYIPFLLEQCKERQISLLVSLFDIDLPVLARICDYLGCEISDILKYIPSNE